MTRTTIGMRRTSRSRYSAKAWRIAKSLFKMRAYSRAGVLTRLFRYNPALHTQVRACLECLNDARNTGYEAHCSRSQL